MTRTKDDNSKDDDDKDEGRHKIAKTTMTRTTLARTAMGKTTYPVLRGLHACEEGDLGAHDGQAKVAVHAHALAV